ncbi:MAG: hypothetical protein KKG69_18065 [Alphaproteobacteria bacterium]|uniref:Uncharacterized protein n=1 Tax=viral metagenome TaxID=1070528 RepID=A0A6H1ZD81_9ZZZZ|nr:hypothetical protein [Alphaproteobacteria bacterium]
MTNKGGRPPKLQPDAATLKLLEGMGQIQCTTKEASCVLRVAETTFLRFIAEHPDARDAFEMGKGSGLHSLRRTQFKLAEKNAAMAIFLGKNYLGQADKQDITASVVSDVTVNDARGALQHLITRQSAAGPDPASPEQPN